MVDNDKLEAIVRQLELIILELRLIIDGDGNGNKMVDEGGPVQSDTDYKS